METALNESARGSAPVQISETEDLREALRLSREANARIEAHNRKLCDRAADLEARMRSAERSLREERAARRQGLPSDLAIAQNEILRLRAERPELQEYNDDDKPSYAHRVYLGREKRAGIHESENDYCLFLGEPSLRQTSFGQFWFGEEMASFSAKEFQDVFGWQMAPGAGPVRVALLMKPFEAVPVDAASN